MGEAVDPALLTPGSIVMADASITYPAKDEGCRSAAPPGIYLWDLLELCVPAADQLQTQGRSA